MDNILVEQTINNILDNIDQKGFERYDPLDLTNILNTIHNGTVRILLHKAIRVFEVYMPVVFRKIVGIKKSKFPTAYTHICMAYLNLESNKAFSYSSRLSSDKIIKLAMQEYLNKDGDDCYWVHKNFITTFPVDQIFREDKHHTMHLHGLARFGICLLKLYHHTNDINYLELSYKTLKTTLKQHRIIWEDDRCYINYYPNTDDCTLNISSEFLEWLSAFPEEYFTDEMKKISLGIINLLFSEQNEDGSFFYCSKEYISKNLGSNFIDNHHTATVIRNMINAMQNGICKKNCEEGLYEKVVSSCEKGIDFFIDKFFDSTGSSLALYKNNRLAHSADYGESITCFCSVIRSDFISQELKNRVLDLLPKVIGKAIDLVRNDGSAPTEYYLGHYCNYDSIRWGNGPIVEGLCDYMKLFYEVKK